MISGLRVKNKQRGFGVQDHFSCNTWVEQSGEQVSLMGR